MPIGKLLPYQNKNLKFQIVMKSLMSVNLQLISVGQGAYGIVVAAKDK
jgi:D-serine deaminase-like pyridoxal phosphate-dependent protein